MWSDIIIYGVIGLLTVDFLCCSYIIAAIELFLRRTPRLDSHLDLKRYCDVVSQCMYAAFLFIATIAVASAVCVAAFAAQLVREADFLPAVGWFLGRVVVLGVFTAVQEQRLKEIPTGSPLLARARDEVATIYDRDPFPRRLNAVSQRLTESDF